jgi:putative ABC transport system permease protein
VQREVVRLFQSEDGLRLIQVTRLAKEPGEQKGGPFAALQMGEALLPLSDADLSAIAALPGVDSVVPEFDLFLSAQVETPTGKRPLPFVQVGGAHPGEAELFRKAILHGRLWTPADVRPCLLLKGFGKPEELIGRTVTFTGFGEEGDETRTFTCVGVFDPFKLGLRSCQLAVPYDQALELRDRAQGGMLKTIPYKKGTYPRAAVWASDARKVDDVATRLKNLDSGYQTIGMKDILRAVDVVFFLIEGLLASIGAIGLLVSLFGIANTMAMAVLERTREIGIMKALGARNRDVGRLFLAEAAGIGLLGGTVGLASGWLLGLVLGWAARRLFDLPEGTALFHVSNLLAAGALVFSVVVSVLAGVLPARRAARLDPVAALRYE